MTASRIVLAAALSLAAIGPCAFAQGLPDPTKPQAAWQAAHARALGKEAPVEAASNDARVVVERPGGAFVIVDGSIVRPGQTHNGAKLISIGEGGAVWQRGGTREAPEAEGAVVKTPVTAADARTVRKKTQVNGEKQ
jgi:hypothetical protein